MQDQEAQIRRMITMALGTDWAESQGELGLVELIKQAMDRCIDVGKGKVVSAVHLDSGGTPVWNMNGIRLNLSALALIADTLEKHGSVLVRMVAIDPEAPTVRELGFKIIHGTEPDQYLTKAVRLNSKEHHA